MRQILIAPILCLAIGCSQPSAPAPEAPSLPNAVRFEPLAALPHQGILHLTTSSAGIFYSAEPEDGHDGVMRVNDRGALEATSLNYSAVAAAMGFPQVTGNFQGLAANGDFLYFYFASTPGEHFHAAFGRYSAAGGKIEILSQERQLSAIAAAGNELSISRGELVCSGNMLWLWLHSIDASYFLQMDIGDAKSTVGLQRNFDHLQADFLKPELIHEGYLTGAGGHGSLLITDPWAQEVWEITTRGVALPRGSLVELPANVSAPVIDHRDRVFVFVARGEKSPLRFEWQKPLDIPARTQFPAFLILAETQTDSFSGSELLGKWNFPVEQMKFTAISPTGSPDEWIGYDPNSSELFRIKLVVQ